MIERIPDQIPVQTGEWRGTTFDIIPKETFAMACRKINELVDAVNRILDIAVGAIKKADHHIRICHYVQARTDLRQALEQITALEQKERK
jgi:hypothetical protein